jgi:hypothetical protein
MTTIGGQTLRAQVPERDDAKQAIYPLLVAGHDNGC